MSTDNKQIHYMSCLNKDKITVSDILYIQNLCYENIHTEDMYNIRNDAKLRAIYSTKSYDEFK